MEVTEEQVKQAASSLYYQSSVWYHSTTWRGIPVWKPPTDLWTYQEIIWQTRPDYLIETGTAYGGSAVFYADIMDRVGHGRVITIDIDPLAQPEHPRVSYVTGDSLEMKLDMLEGSRCMVSLDSDHTKDHVLKELELYYPIVGRGCYLVCEDTHITYNRPDMMPGPGEALDEFLAGAAGKLFIRDPSRENQVITFMPGGWLKRVA